MTKDSIKISQEINFNGMPTWVSVGASLQQGDDVLESLKSLQKDITDYHQSAAKEYQQSKWRVKPDNSYGPFKSLIEEMDACIVLDKDAGGLLSFELTIKNAEERAFYEQKLIELSSKNQ